ncbi:hypothetical protein HOLleu_01485 [Holothuria leucospilota]|uniref:Uncharacterized protein n=1 Tax=Holothuria leucospilota TaxID=206669 RepID=A0A9Q1HKV7_HOLLE|nr:hypothetical protein HOLleu_01485 [Holothuria leucospilota]
MKLQHYHNDPRDYEHYYLQQVGNGLPVFHGARVQKGYGMGNILGGLFRSAMPLFKRGAKALGKEALRTGVEIAGDVLHGTSLRRAAKTRGISAGRRVTKRAASAITEAKNVKRPPNRCHPL